MTLRMALDRTILLMRDAVSDRVDDNALLEALTGTRVALVADGTNIASHSAQTAFVTAAMLMARSGHTVHLIAPDCPLTGPQLPLSFGRMVEALLDAGTRLLPGVGFRAGNDGREYDLALALGDSPVPVAARRAIRLNAGPWVGRIDRANDTVPWDAQWWPMGGMTAAALAATEAFKVALWKIDARERFHSGVRELLAESHEVSFALAPAGTPYCREIGDFDCISGGAITNALLYILTRIPGVDGRARVFDAETPDLSNLNRYMLLLRSAFTIAKVRDLAAMCGTTLPVVPIAEHYTPALLGTIGSLADAVLIGVDHIPSRWAVQRANPAWLGIGATSHWDAMASFHRPGIACAQCLHPRYTPSDATIPTVAFVSFWAGLLTAAYFLRHRAKNAIPLVDQHVYLTALRPEYPYRARVEALPNCPSCMASKPLRPQDNAA